MMVVEVIAMVWAAGGLAIYNLYPELMTHKPTEVSLRITDYFLGHYVGSITVLAVIILAATSGDTATAACCRLTLAEGFHIKRFACRHVCSSAFR